MIHLGAVLGSCTWEFLGSYTYEIYLGAVLGVLLA
jgi:hypothetical protein